MIIDWNKCFAYSLVASKKVTLNKFLGSLCFILDSQKDKIRDYRPTKFHSNSNLAEITQKLLNEGLVKTDFMQIHCDLIAATSAEFFWCTFDFFFFLFQKGTRKFGSNLVCVICLISFRILCSLPGISRRMRNTLDLELITVVKILSWRD